MCGCNDLCLLQPSTAPKSFNLKNPSTESMHFGPFLGAWCHYFDLFRILKSMHCTLKTPSCILHVCSESLHKCTSEVQLKTSTFVKSLKRQKNLTIIFTISGCRRHLAKLKILSSFKDLLCPCVRKCSPWKQTCDVKKYERSQSSAFVVFFEILPSNSFRFVLLRHL